MLLGSLGLRRIGSLACVGELGMADEDGAREGGSDTWSRHVWSWVRMSAIVIVASPGGILVVTNCSDAGFDVKSGWRSRRMRRKRRGGDDFLDRTMYHYCYYYYYNYDATMLRKDKSADEDIIAMGTLSLPILSLSHPP